jgi:predicted nucleotidyltransferase
MQSSFVQHILEVCKSLNNFSVQYLIIGGTAVGFHGHYRDTTDNMGMPIGKHDFDFWFNPSLENYFNVIKAIKALGKDVSRLENESAPNPKKSFLRFEFEEFKVDFLPEVAGLTFFNESFSRRRQTQVNGIIIKILSFEDLMKTKETNPRQKDLNDIIELKKIRGEDDQVQS